MNWMKCSEDNINCFYLARSLPVPRGTRTSAASGKAPSSSESAPAVLSLSIEFNTQPIVPSPPATTINCSTGRRKNCRFENIEGHAIKANVRTIFWQSSWQLQCFRHAGVWQVCDLGRIQLSPESRQDGGPVVVATFAVAYHNQRCPVVHLWKTCGLKKKFSTTYPHSKCKHLKFRLGKSLFWLNNVS